jgi:CRISPR-associated endonuclease/helicase Cas3
MQFALDFHALTKFGPLSWQTRLYAEHFARGDIPSAVDIPTGLGKTMVMALWLIALARGARLPRRLVYVVDRRAVVDQATQEAVKLAAALENKSDPRIAALRSALGFRGSLPISTLRGAYVDNGAWRENPASPAIVVGTVDMIGSRLLFEGYGVSRRMRPYHAGLLGVDALVALDEAHLARPFAHLLKSIAEDAALRPKDGDDRKRLPRFALLPLSATQRDPGGATGVRRPFRLEDGDAKDAEVKRRLDADKRLELRAFAEGDCDLQMARAAWELATQDGPARVAIFCDRRDKSDEGKGPSAIGVRAQIEKLARESKKLTSPAFEIPEPQLLVGGRRVRERKAAACKLKGLGFIGDKTTLEAPAFLIATSAGEVGVDLDADHMVCDLVAFERMAQRLGRVNRRGTRESSRVVVFYKEPAAPRKADEISAQEKRALIAFNAKAVIEELPKAGDARDASPGALRALAERARSDARLEELIDKATTPEPLRPALTRALVDAWSMTSLEAHTGRPEIAPWLRGWEEDEKPQTTVVWRTHLPVRFDDTGRVSPENYKEDIEAFFAAAPPHASEKLETETFRVVPWLAARASRTLKGAKRSGAAEGVEAQAEGGTAPKECLEDDIVVFALSPRGDFEKAYSARQLLEKREGDAKKRFEAELDGRTLVIDAQLGGIGAGVGLLDAEVDKAASTADNEKDWNRDAEFRVRPATSREPGDDKDWRYADDFVRSRNQEREAVEWLIVERLKGVGASSEEARSIARPQMLVDHQELVKKKAIEIAQGVGLVGDYAQALAIAARGHDEGKRADKWQSAFNAARDCRMLGLQGPLAKTRGPINQKLLDGYRHEFGSLPHVEKDDELKALPEDLQDLVLHLVAAHHGGARPVIGTRGCDDAPPSALEARARDVALRFARLQKRWGPWGLAWWEALLRAADQQASRENDEKRKTDGAG